MSTTKKSLFLIVSLLFFAGIHHSKGQCFTPPNYCTSITANNVGNFGMGIQNVRFDTLATPVQINNTSTLGNGAQIYFDFTAQRFVARSGATVFYSVTGGNSSQTKINIYIDLDNNGVFGATAPEMVANVPNMASPSTVSTGSFVLPALTPGTYRVRVASDGNNNTPPPCGPINFSADYEDYTMFVPSPSMDVIIGAMPSPAFFVTGNNTVGIRFTNPSTSAISTMDIGYQLGNNPPVTQSLTGLGLASGATYTGTFTTPLNISSTGVYTIKVWATNPNGTGSATPANDTTCRTFTVYCSGPLSGVYTIDIAGSGPRNFTSFAVADSNLITCGISGPVVFNVAAGTYNEQIWLPSITGASAANTITFQGADRSNTIVSFNTTAVNPHILRLDNTSFVTFRNMTLRSTTTTNQAAIVHFVNGLSNRVVNCVIDISGAAATSSASSLYGIVNSGSASSLSTNTTGNNNFVDSCMILNGFYGAFSNGTLGTNILYFQNDTFSNQWQNALYASGSHVIKFRNNLVNMRASNLNNVGVYLINNNASGTNFHEFNGNSFYGLGVSAMQFLTSSGSGSSMGQIYNNFITGFRGSSNIQAINMNSSRYNIWHNSINIDNATSGTNGCLLFQSSASTNDVRNNNLTITNAGAVGASPISTTSAATMSALDYNNYFNANNSNIVVGMNVTTANYKATFASGGAGLNSTNINPAYLNNTSNLHTANGCNTGINLGLSTDIDGQTRNNPPDIGADETNPAISNDLAVISFVSPVFPVNPGNAVVAVLVRNQGSNNITSFTMSCLINGAAHTGTPVNVSGVNLGPCDTMTVFFSNPYLVSGPFTLSVMSSNPNGMPDNNTTNDSIGVSYCVAMSGVYTIDPSIIGARNFTSWNAAVTALTCAGVSGPVTFNVAANSYYEQLVIGNIQGASATNTITFDGGNGNAASRILSFNATNAAAPHTFRMNGSSFINLRNLTIRSTNGANGWPVHIMEGNNITVRFCNIIVDSLGASATGTNLAPVVMNGSATSILTSSNAINNLFIDSNNIRGGYYGIASQSASQGTTANTLFMRYNNIDSAFYFGVYFGNNTVKIIGNNINMRFNTSANSVGIYTGSVQSNTPLFCEINNNKIFGIGQYGMQLNNFYGSTNNHRINNNFIGRFRATGVTQCFGMDFNFSYSLDIYHNTINVDNATTGGNRALRIAIYSTNINIRNNIFVIGNAGATLAVPIQFTQATAPTNLTHNCYWNLANTNIIQNNLGTIFTTTALNTAFPNGAGSSNINVNPQFPSATDLHLGTAVVHTAFNSTLNLLATVPTDIDNQPRLTTPDMGADEKVDNNVGISAILAPISVTPGVYSIQVRIRNFGNNPISNIPVRYSLNGATPVAETYVPTIAGGDSATYTFTTTATFLACNTLRIFTALVGDVSAFDDSTNRNIGLLFNGVYTINPSGSGSSNFTTFAAAMSALSCGIVTGPVRFDVASGTYTEQVTVPNNIVGVSATNTITFDGGNGNRATRIIQFAPTAAPNFHVLRFNGCSNITFRNLTIRSTTATGGAWVVNFIDGVNNRLNNCIIELINNPSGGSTYYGVVINGNTTTASTASTIANNHLIDSSIFNLNNAYWGIYTSATGGSAQTFRFFNNILNVVHFYAAYSISSHVFKFNNNTINFSSAITNSQGVYLINNNLSGNAFHEINQNRFNNIGQYGIYLATSSGSSIVSSQMYNNFMNGFRSTSGIAGIYNSSSSNWNIYHNTINLDVNTTSGNNAALFLSSGSNFDIRNNIFAVSNTSAVGAFPLYMTTNTGASVLDYNIYFNRSSTSLVFNGGATYTTSNFRVSYPSGGGSNSLNTDPAFVSTTDIHVTNPCNNAPGLGLTVDVDGNPRGGMPDIGADEVNSVPNNEIQVRSITSPGFPLVAGSRTVTVEVRNNGNNPVSSFNVNYTLNNGAVVTQAYTGSPLAPCASTNFTFTTNVTIVNGLNNLKVYTTSPNGNADAIPSNDTAQLNICTAMSGIYTINPSGSGASNFTSFTNAVNNLICAGVNGPVTFNVASGTYNEQIQIPAIQGTSSTNRIIFRSAALSAVACTLSFNPSVLGSYVIYLNGADFITFDRMTIASGYTSTIYLAWLANNADFNTFTGCIFNAPTNQTAYHVFQNNTSDRNNTWIGNTFNNGGFGIYLQGNSTTIPANNRIADNIFSNQISTSTSYAIYSANQDSITITGNTISSTQTSGTYYGIFSSSNTRLPRITKNKITGINLISTAYGIACSNFANNGLTGGRGMIANNFIQLGGTASTNWGIQFNAGSSYTDIMHNSVNMTSTVLSASVGCLYYNTSLVGNTVQNNIFQASGNGITSCAVANIGTSGTSGCVFNNNDFFGRNATFGYCGSANGTAVASYAAFKTGGAAIANFESAGLNREVAFVSTTDLHTATSCISGAGANLRSIVPDDIDGDNRKPNSDLGADEFNVNPFDISTQALLSPTGSGVFATGTPYTVRARVRNNGTATVNQLNMSFRNNNAVTSQTFTGFSLASCDTASFAFTAPLILTSAGTNMLTVYSELINGGSPDQNNQNDTLPVNLCTPYNGEYTINKNLPLSSTNFSSINQALSSIYSCGVSGPVKLRIAAGTGPYNEQITLTGVAPGASRTNTITLTGGPTREAITFSPTISTAQHTIRLITTRHIILDSLTINNTGTSFGVGVHLVTTADSNAVRNSIINISLASTSFTNSAGIAISTNAAAVTGTGNNGNRNIIDNNQINGGHFGISVVGIFTSTFCRFNEITRNRLNGQAYYGIYHYYQAQTKVNGNTVDNMLASSPNSYGMIFAGIDSFEINKNIINRFGQYGMYFNGMNHIGGTGTYRSQIINNMIGGTAYNTTPYGVYVNIASAPLTYRNVDFWHNTIHLNNIGGGYVHFFQNTSSSTSISGLDYRNNTFTASNNTTTFVYLYWANLGTPFTTFAKNNVYSFTNPTGTYFYMNNTTASGSSWISPNFGSINTSTCVAVDPGFLNQASNLRTLSTPLSNIGVNIPAVTEDVDGDPRPLSPSTTVDIGADEYNVPAFNTGVVAVLSPVSPMTVGLQDVTVQIRNFGTAALTSANVSYKVGVNGMPRTVAWTGSLATGASANLTFTGANQFNFTGSFDTVIAWTDGPNGVLDEFVPNDTFVSNVVCQPLSGTYTLDNSLPSSATNFTSFAALANSLNNCGVTGPVTVNVAANTYNEQFVLRQFPGTSATNTVTIQSVSGVASSVNIQFNLASSALNNYVVYMNGADNVIFKNVTFTDLNTTFGSTIIWQANNSRFNTFQNVIFNGPANSSTSTNYALVFANNQTLVNAGQGDDNNTFTGCTFNNGSYGIYYNGTYGSTYSNNTIITNNTFTNQSNMGVYLWFHFNMNVSGNVITTNSTNTCNGIYYYGGGVVNSGAASINKNRIDIANSGNGLYLEYLQGSNTIVANNMVRVGSGSNTAYALYGRYIGCRVYNNTLVTNSGNTTMAAAYIFNPNTINPVCDFKYNIIVNRGNGSTAGFAAYYYYPSSSGLNALNIDSNAYFCGTGATTQFVHFNSSLSTTNNFTSYAAWRTYISGLLGTVNTDQNSLYTSPSFVSTADLHIATPTNVMNIPSNAFVPDDIDNTPRCGSNTDVGADHHPQNNDIGVAAITYPPSGVAALGSQTIRVLIRNLGGNPVTSANVSYNINGTVVTQAWTGTLNTCDTTTVVFSTPYVFVPGSFTMSAFTDGPNGTVDSRVSNDTLTVNGCIGMGGAYTIDAAAPASATNFQSFGAAISAMTGCGVTAPTVFTVAAGTYIEQVNVPFINGSSSVNTITFDGGTGNAATRMLKFPTTSLSPFIVRLNTTSNVYFRNLTIQTTNQNNAWNVHFFNSTNCGVAQCIINDSINQYGTSNNVYRVMVNGSTSAPTTASIVSNNIYIDSNDIGFGYYSVLSSVNNPMGTTHVRGNTFSTTSSSWVYAINNHCLKIKFNYFRTNAPVGSGYLPMIGVMLLNATPNTALFHEISNNRMDSILGHFVQISSSNGNSTNYAQFYNNMISGSYWQAGGHHCVFGNNNSFWKFYNNSINLNLSANHTAFPLYQNGGSSNEVRNNILAVTDPNQAGCASLGASSSAVFSAVDNNILFNAASPNLMRIVATNYTAANHNAAAWPSGAGLGSRSFDPRFVSAEDLHVNSSVRCRLISPNPGVPDDIDNQARGLSSCSGADEVFGINNDLSIDAITSPTTTSITAGGAALSVLVRNSGSNTVSSGNVSYSLNGATPVTAALPAPLAPCDTMTITFATVPFATGTNNITVFTDGPNGVADANPTNDTVRNFFCTLLSGNYTVDRRIPASGTNFVSLSAAISALYTCGLSGPVNITIAAGSGPYTEQLTFNSIIPGSSRTNTITIDGGSSKETVQFSGASSSLSHVFRLNGAKYITLRNMTINTLNVNWGIGVQLANISDSNVVEGNIINMTGTSDTRNAGITLSAIGTTALLAGNNGNFNIIRNNTINNGAYGMAVVGVSSGVYNKANQLINNTIRNAFTNGINIQFQDSLRIIGNDIEMTNANVNSYGMFISYVDRFQVNKNKVNKCGQGGIIFNQFTNFNFGAATTDSAEVSNNMIGGIFYGTGTVYGLFFGSNYLRNVNIYNNSISVNTTMPQLTYGIFMQYTTSGFYSNNKLVNNNAVVYNSTGAAAYLQYSSGFTPATPFAMCDYNNFLNTDFSANQVYLGTSNYGYGAPVAPWIGIGGFNINSLSKDPNFLNPLTDLHVVHPNLDSMGISIAQVTDDIDGNARNASKPDIGADEFNVPAENIGVSAIVSPAFPLTTGLQDVTVQIKNYGTITITSATVKYRVGVGGAVKTSSWTGSLAVGATTNVTFFGANQHNFTGVYDTIITWTESPNGVPDGYTVNDTSRSTTCSPLSGAYTLDAGLPASATNFVSFAQLKDRLNTCGVNGPVTINVDTAVINEQIVFTPFPGASAANRVTIQSTGGNPATVTWQFPAAGGTNNFMVHLDGADYMTFRNMTFNASSNTTFSTAVRMGNAAIGIEFIGNVFNGNSATLTSINQVLVHNYTNTLSQSDDNAVFKKNTFVSGTFAIYSVSSTQLKNSWLIDSNVFIDQYQHRIYLISHRNAIITNNVMTTSIPYTLACGIFLQSCVSNGGNFTVAKNKISGIAANYGMFLQSCSGTAINPFLVMNNFVQVGSGSNTAYAMYFTGCFGTNVYHNSLNLTSSNGNPFFWSFSSSSPRSEVKYNVIASTGSGSASPWVLNISLSTPASNFMLMDSNVYFQGTGPVGFSQGSFTTANLAAWKATALLLDANSITTSTFPFVSSTDLHINSLLNLYNINTNPMVPDDIDGTIRSGITDAGADHHPIPIDAGVSSIAYPSGGVASPGLQDIVVVIRNYGVNNLTAANVSYNINGTVQTKPWTGNLVTGATDTVIFSGAQQYNFTSSFTMKAYTDSPNVVMDPLNTNDTAFLNGCIGMAGNYTIDPSGAGPTNFTSFSNAIAGMQSCGISGPVVFQVAAGLYREQLHIPLIAGSSSTNTITFDGGTGNASTRIIQWPGTVASPSIVLFNATSNVTVKNMTISASSADNHYNVNFFNSSNCRLVGCILTDSANVSDPPTSFNSLRILLSGSATSNIAGAINNNIYIDSNITNNGHYAIFSSMNNGLNTIFIRNNAINNPSMGIMNISGAQTVKLIGNIFRPKLRGGAWNPQMGVYFNNASPGGSNFHEIRNNISDSTFGYAYQLVNSNGSGLGYNIFANNIIYGVRYAGMSAVYNTGSYWRFYHNSVAMDFNASHTAYCFQQQGGTNGTIDVRNNIFAVTNSNQNGSMPVLITSSAILSNFDFNNLFNAASANDLLRIGSINTGSSAAYPSGIGVNSRSENPLFFGPTNLHIPSSMACILRGQPGLGITTDMDNQNRATTPIMGADEIFAKTDDISVQQIVSPTSSITAAAYNVVLLLKNVGNNTINSANISYTLNGGAPVTITLPAPISACDTASVVISGVTFTSGSNSFVTYTSAPNGNTDADFSNDTAKTTFCTPLSGTYTIGGTAPDYATFTNAVNALNCGGVSGPVVFNVRNGVYNEAIQINAIVGSSATNTVTFQSQSGTASSVTLQNGTIPGYTFKLLNADNVIIRNMTIRANLANTNPIQILAINDSAVNNQIYGNTIISQWLTSSNQAAVFISGRVPNVMIRKNIMSNASFAVHATGVSGFANYPVGITIDSNTINNSAGSDAYSVFFIQNYKTPVIRYNTIAKSGCCADQGFTLNNIGFGGIIAYNKIITSTSMSYAMSIQNVNLNNETTPLTIYNNFISQNGSGGSNIVMNGTNNYVHFYNNSVNFVNAGSGYNLSITNASGVSSNIRIVNNIFKSPSGMFSLFFTGTSLATTRSMIAECDYNNYFQGTGAASENILSLQGINYTNTTMRGAIYTTSPRNDTNSCFYNPLFVSNSDLHVLAGSQMDGRGKVIPLFNDDIDGQLRIASSYDIGADDTLFIRKVAGDFVKSTNCIPVSGTGWTDFADSVGKLVFSINPEGNNLGNVCWGVRINSGPLRTDSVFNSADSAKYFSLFLDRNIYINPSIQPAPGTSVTIRMYVAASEWKRLADSAMAKYGITMNAYYTKIHRYHQAGATTALTPLTAKPASGDSSHFLYTLSLSDYLGEKQLQFRTSNFSQFNPLFIPNVPPYLLPVTWLDFNAKVKDRDAILDWSTASEKNSEMFELERSHNGKEFETVGKVKAAGNSASVKLYNFIDKNAAGLGHDKLYYRIKQIDKDGTTDYSKTRAVSFVADESIVMQYVGPNPFKSELHVDFTLPKADNASIGLFDINGKQLLNVDINGVKGNNAHTIKVGNIASGIYFLKIKSGDQTYVEKVVKQE